VVTTSMVFLMVFIAAAFFFVVDQVMSYAVRWIFGLGQA
jgi:preprotein translocase subunit SecE